MKNQGNKIVYQDTLLVKPISALDTTSLKQVTNDSTTKLNLNKFKEESKVNGNPLYETGKTISNNLVTKNDTISQGPELIKIYPNSKSLISNYQDTQWFSSTQDKTCYYFKNLNSRVETSLFSNDKKTTHQTTTNVITIKEKSQKNHDWAIIPILFGMIILASIVTVYRKYLGQLFESTIYRFAFSKYEKEKNSPFQRFSLFLDFLFIISLSLLVDQVVRKFGLFTFPFRFEYLFFLIFCSFLMFIRVVRWTIYKLSALFSNQEKFFNELFRNSTLYTRTLGVFLLPMVFLISYTTGFISIFLIYLSVSATAIFLILRTIRLLRVFVVGGFSIFYFILYLCALEIAPLLVIWKEVNSR